jgi:hypothetical protein
MTRDEATICSGCGAEARIPGQRYGRQCMNEANRKYRARMRRMIESIAGRRGRGDDFVSVKK